MRFLQVFAVAVLVSSLPFDASLLVAGDTDALPNIVVILADDLGYGDVQPNNPDSKVATPNFKKLALEGVNFVDAHSGSGVCTPTRYGLVCGRYCWRTSLKSGVLGGYSKPLIAKDQQTIAQVLGSAGYTTHCIGKWHLGLGWQWRDAAPKRINDFGIAGGKPMVDYSLPILDSPIHHGFDDCYIIPASLDMSPYVFIKGDRVTQLPKGTIPGRKFPAFYRKGEISPDFRHIDCLGHLTDRACSFIKEQQSKDKPYFLYFPMPAPHKPVIPAKEFQGTSKMGPYGDFIRQVDHSIGQVIQAIDRDNHGSNTILIVTSDNGSFMDRLEPGLPDHMSDPSIQGYSPTNHSSNGRLRGTKADVWEGGHRVPFMVRWPDRIKGNRIVKKTICLTDILATAADAAGAKFSDTASPDSFSFLKLACDEKSVHDRPMVINHSSRGIFAIRDGQWKLVLGNGSGGRAKPRGMPFERPFELYNLESDLSETQNVFEQNPEQVKKMLAAFETLAPGEAKRIKPAQ